MTQKDIRQTPHSQLERLRFIERQLMWGRSFKARMLMDHFGVSRPQVSADLKHYKKLFPDNVNSYNPKEKAYTPSTVFTPHFDNGFTDTFVEGSVLYGVRKLSRVEDIGVLSTILAAIQGLKGVELIYASTSNPIGAKRIIFPTRIISASNRLHFRGFCETRMEYRDFSISRCMTKPKLRKPPKDIPEDFAWNEQVELELMVNPYLSMDGQKLVTHEYQELLLEPINLPKAMVHYFLIDNNLPSSDEQFHQATKNPWSYPLVIQNESKLLNHLFRKLSD